jgi:hypothetical protein
MPAAHERQLAMAFDETFFRKLTEQFRAQAPDERYKVARNISRRELVARLHDDIIAKRKAGYSLEGIAAQFEELGAPIRPSTLQKYLRRPRDTKRARRGTEPTHAPRSTSPRLAPTNSRAHKPIDHDPIPLGSIAPNTPTARHSPAAGLSKAQDPTPVNKQGDSAEPRMINTPTKAHGAPPGVDTEIERARLLADLRTRPTMPSSSFVIPRRKSLDEL